MGNTLPPEITFLLPAFNEEKSIGVTVARLKQLYPEHEILVVDDGSTDSTKSAAIASGAKCISHPYKIGNGAAIKTGLRNAQSEWVLMMDADGQHDPNDIDKILAHKNEFDMVVGARAKGSNSSLHRKLANWAYNRLASYITKRKIHDLTSGFRLVRLEMAKKFIYLLPNAFSYPTTITMAYLRSGLSVKYVPIKTHKRTGKSKIKILQDGARFLLIIAKVATLFSPFRIFLPTSIIFFMTGIGYYLFTFLTTGRFTNMSALLLSTSVIIFMIGLVSEQVAQIRYDRVQE